MFSRMMDVMDVMDVLNVCCQCVHTILTFVSCLMFNQDDAELKVHWYIEYNYK